MSEKNLDEVNQNESYSNNSINRRGYLKLTGAGVALVSTVTLESNVAQAASYGYGESGYGEGPYGGSVFDVTTTSATNVESTSATLNGELFDLDGTDSRDCYFEWRQTGVSDWNRTAKQTLSSAGSFSSDISKLSEGTEYEYRAMAGTNDGDTVTGSTAMFITDSSSSTPVINRFSVSEAGRPNPHAEITVVWDVSDADGDLSSVNIEVSESGETVSGVSWNLDGATASDTDSFKIKQSDGKTFDLKLTVTDTEGNSVSTTQSVTE